MAELLQKGAASSFKLTMDTRQADGDDINIRCTAQAAVGLGVGVWSTVAAKELCQLTLFLRSSASCWIEVGDRRHAQGVSFRKSCAYALLTVIHRQSV